MKTLKFKKIDAFTKGLSTGNPAGYVYLDENQRLSENEMQQVALELKGFVNEVGFVTRRPDGFHLKFYSSECEVEFCGHATIAIMYDLLNESTDLISQKEVNIHVNAGPLTAFNYLNEMDAVYIIAPSPNFIVCTLEASSISAALGIDKSDIDEDFKIEKIDGGLRTLIVPIKSLDACLAMYPNEASLKAFCLNNNIDIILVFSKETFNKSADYRTRVFAPKFGYLEDPATGSGNSAFGYYLDKHNKLNAPLLIEQSANKENANFVRLKAFEHKGKTRMLFGGCATTRIHGQYLLHI